MRATGRHGVSRRSFGKKFLIETPLVTVRIHLLMFGGNRVDYQIGSRACPCSLPAAS